MFSLFDVPPIQLNGLIVIQDLAGKHLVTCRSLSILPITTRQNARVWGITTHGSDVIITVSDYQNF